MKLNYKHPIIKEKFFCLYICVCNIHCNLETEREREKEEKRFTTLNIVFSIYIIVYYLSSINISI